MAYACLGCFIGYLLRIEPTIWLFSIGLVNLPFYTMEIRHCYCKEFMMIVGEVGPVEIELIYSIILFFTGAVFGGDVYERSITDLTGF